MRIYVTQVFVDDQTKALAFYTGKLGFVVKEDVPVGEFRWLTVTGTDEPDGPELLLEPNAHAAVRPYQSALKADGIPAASFAVDDVQAEYARLLALGVEFVAPPEEQGGEPMAVLDDTCGNLLQLVQIPAGSRGSS